MSPGLTRRLAENFSWPLILATLGLMACGLINLYSATSTPTGEMSHNFLKQVIFAAIGLVGLGIFFVFDYRNLKSLVWPLFILSIILLVAVKFFGVKAGGAQRWLPFGPFRFQPSELAKIALILLLAQVLAKKEHPTGLDFKDLLWPLPLILGPFFLILKQPDLGTALHLILSVAPIFFLAKLRLRVIITLVSLVAAMSAWIFFLGGQQFLLDRGLIKPYQLDRVRYYFTPKAKPTDEGWQIIQAENAIGGGQILGQGFQEGTQQKYGFLPARETDFAFAALAEEWGFVGASVIIFLFFCLFWAALNIVKRGSESFGAYLAIGLTSLIFWQMAINIAMVVGLFPVVGIPLPFISYGGSALFASLLAVAIIANIGLNRYVFQDEAIKQNPQVWAKGVTAPKEPATEPIRRLAPPNPDEPEPYPDHRLPRRQVWLKYLRKPERPFFE
ncbi:MAG: rod shape-determining protein RodA [Deltaproteobacteria bacterium]|jgi:rod shape determining protein RodA|nr:rod shape-determining protein RodA [Deltaproteobacteria bacterium]